MKKAETSNRKTNKDTTREQPRVRSIIPPNTTPRNFISCVMKGRGYTIPNCTACLISPWKDSGSEVFGLIRPIPHLSDEKKGAMPKKNLTGSHERRHGIPHTEHRRPEATSSSSCSVQAAATRPITATPWRCMWKPSTDSRFYRWNRQR